MNKSEFAAAFELAHNHDIDWSQVDDTMTVLKGAAA